MASSAMRLSRSRTLLRPRARAKERKERWELESFRCQDFLDPDNPTTLILVGGTGSSKSALGNFLLDPSERHLLKAPTFKVGHTGAPETKSVQVGHGHGVTVIDTAGFNGSEAEDWENMVNCVKDLRSIGTFHIVVLVMKFEDKMSQHWKDTVSFYSKIGKAFAENLVIVLNAYRPGSRNLQAAGGDPRRANMEGASKEVQALLQLPAPPLVFALDSYLDEDRYVKLHLLERKEILQHAAQQQPTSLAGLMVPKTECMLRKHELEVEGLTARRARLSRELAESLPSLADVKEQIAKLTQKDKELLAQIGQKENIIQKLDTKDMVELEARRVSISEVRGSCFPRRAHKVPFCRGTDTIIRQTKVDYTCSRYTLRCGSKYLSGSFEQDKNSGFLGGYPSFQGEVRVYSWSKDIHHNEIQRGRQEVQNLKQTRVDMGNQRKKLQNRLSQIEAPVQQLQEALRGIDEKMRCLKLTHLTVEEAESLKVHSTP